jgi:hypothetical protein
MCQRSALASVFQATRSPVHLTAFDLNTQDRIDLHDTGSYHVVAIDTWRKTGSASAALATDCDLHWRA